MDSRSRPCTYMTQKRFLRSMDRGSTWERQEGPLKNGVYSVERVGPSLFAFVDKDHKGTVKGDAC